MRSLQLIPYVSEMTGENGLVFAGTFGDSIVSDIEGGLLAHDLVEHQNGFTRIGDPADELEAIGGIWHARGRHADLGGTICPAKAVSYDVVATALDAGHWTPLNINTRPHDYDEDFHLILDHARRDLDDEDFTDVSAFLDDALALMRVGFNKANRRFGSGFKSNNTYHAVKRAVGPFCKDPTPCTLRYGNGEATCHENPLHY